MILLGNLLVLLLLYCNYYKFKIVSAFFFFLWITDEYTGLTKYIRKLLERYHILKLVNVQNLSLTVIYLIMTSYVIPSTVVFF